MKVLFVTRKYPPSVGGMEQFAYELSTALAGKTDIGLVKWGGSGRAKAVLVALPYLSLRATGALLAGGIDIIHAQDGLLAPSAYVLSRFFRKRFTVVIHGLDATYTNPLFRAVVPAALRHADIIFCISQAAADEAVKRGVSKSKIQVIPLAVVDKFQPDASRLESLQELDLPAEAKILLTVGRLVKRKGVAWFIQNVLPELTKQYPDLIYVVVGAGEQQSAIEAMIKQQKMAKHVRLLGRVDNLQPVYAAADVFVMPNINVPGDVEGFGLVLLEASTCQLPVVAADTEGIRDAVVDGKNGVLVPVQAAAAFGREIQKFLDHPEAAKKFGVQSRRFTLDNYQWDKIADRYLEQYRRLLH